MTSLAAALLLAAVEPAPQATIPLPEYERLRRLSERPALTVVDLLHLEGSFAGRDLAVAFTGRSAGAMPTVEVLEAPRARLHSCKGDALLSRDKGGGFALTPLAPRFQVRCRVALDGSDRLEASASRSVLEVESAVRDGELVGTQADGGAREFSVVRAIAGPAVELPPSVTARYQVTLLPEETRFSYRLEVRNPSRGHRRYPVALKAGEHVESVDAQVAWDAEGSTYRFDLPPGETVLQLRGRLEGSTFRPPVDANLQYLLLESHPLIRPDVRSEAKRVGAGETGLTAAHRGAQAFLLDGKGEVAWNATRLEALKTAGIALGHLEQVFFLGADGKARGEATFSIDNQGAPAFALPTAGEPTFASVGGEAAFLTRDAAGRLFLPLAQGRQLVAVQDVRPFRTGLGFAVARLELPRAGVPASVAQVQLRYPAEWRPLYEELAPSSRLHLLGAGELLALAILLLAVERLLALAGLSRTRRWPLALALVLAGAFSTAVLSLGLALAALAWMGLAAALLYHRLRGGQRFLALAALGGAALVLSLVGGGIWSFDARNAGSGPANYMLAQQTSGVLDEKLVAAAARVSVAPAAAPAKALPAPQGASGYQGLPARIEIHMGAAQTAFRRELLATDSPRPVFVLLVASRTVAFLAAVTALLGLGLALLFRRDLAAGARAYAARIAGPRPGAP